jgi:hypothetical protein
MVCYFVACGKAAEDDFALTTKSPASNTPAAEATPNPRIAATIRVTQSAPGASPAAKCMASIAPRIPPKPATIRVYRDNSSAAWHAGH